MKIQNASIFPTPQPDQNILPQVLCTDRGFWQTSIDPAAGGTLPGPGVIPEIDTQRLKAICGKANSSFNSTIIFDIENPALAFSSAPPDLFADYTALVSRIIDLAHGFGVKDVSLYGLPYAIAADANYRTTADLWEQNDLRLKPILAKCDSLSPCWYSADMELASWELECDECAEICLSYFPGKPIRPLWSFRGGFEGTDGHYEDKKNLAYRRMVFLSKIKVDCARYWDANFGNPPTTYQTLGDIPYYNMLKMAAQYDPIWPPDGPNWLA